MPSRSSRIDLGRTELRRIGLRWPLLALLGWAALHFCAPAIRATEAGSSFDVQISLSQKASAKLASLSEGIVVAATWSGNPAPGAKTPVNQIGQIDLGRETVEVSGRSQTVRVTGADLIRNRLPDVEGPVLLNVNVYSARHGSPDNVLNCSFFDGILRDAVSKPVAIHCSLITEKADNNSGQLGAIPPARAADSYAIYALLIPGGPADKISSSQVQHWSIADTTVSINQMNPAIPPDGQLKAPPDNVKAFSDAVEDFAARKYERFHLDSAHFNSVRFGSLLNDQQIESLRQAASNSTGIAFFSAVYFNNTQTAALVYVNDWCANLCAVGQWVYLEKHGGQWVRRSGIQVPGV